ncbi:MAG: phosphatidate cytidylyltransferase [Treponema sp.]|jgi:dolichol kinase|nr:phosphatidate cytidylyltransferase [Treponema sp.]
MERTRFLDLQASSGSARSFAASGKDVSELKTEIVRKSIHFLIALSPLMASISRPVTVLFLMAGTLGYTLMEYLRFCGVRIPVISSLTNMASRSRDMGRFVMGPVTLGLGALLALLLYPSPVASIAIYALAFGDGFASLIGKLFGKWRPAILCGKSVEGSLACFSAVFISAYSVSHNINIAIVAAFTATVVEALPLEDYDNMLIPVTVGLAVQFVSFL